MLHGAGFHDLAMVDHRHLVGCIRHHAEIVGDQQHRHLEALLQVAQQLQDLRLDGDVERRGRLVGDQQRRPADQRHGDHRPLPEPAGQLEGIHVVGFARMREADQPQHLLGLVPRFLPRHRLVQLQRLLDLVADGVHR